MKSNLIEIRNSDFVNKDTEEVVKGYVALFLIPSRDERYSPSLVKFYIPKRSLHGQILSEILENENCKEKTNVFGIGAFDISFAYNKDKTYQKLKYLRQV